MVETTIYGVSHSSVGFAIRPHQVLGFTILCNRRIANCGWILTLRLKAANPPKQEIIKNATLRKKIEKPSLAYGKTRKSAKALKKRMKNF